MTTTPRMVMLCNSDESETHLIVCLKWKHFCVCRDKMSWQLGCVWIIGNIGLIARQDESTEWEEISINDFYVVLCSQFSVAMRMMSIILLHWLTFDDVTFDWYEVGFCVAWTKPQVGKKRSKNDRSSAYRSENHQWKSYFDIFAHFVTLHMTIPENSLIVWIYCPFEKPQ